MGKLLLTFILTQLTSHGFWWLNVFGSPVSSKRLTVFVACVTVLSVIALLVMLGIWLADHWDKDCG